MCVCLRVCVCGCVSARACERVRLSGTLWSLLVQLCACVCVCRLQRRFSPPDLISSAVDQICTVPIVPRCPTVTLTKPYTLRPVLCPAVTMTAGWCGLGAAHRAYAQRVYSSAHRPTATLYVCVLTGVCVLMWVCEREGSFLVCVNLLLKQTNKLQTHAHVHTFTRTVLGAVP